MARSVLQDFLHVSNFWIMDVGIIEPGSLPVFIPAYGFSSMTAPSIEGEVKEIVEGNWPFARKVFKGASIPPLTLQRGVSFEDSDFWRWTMATALGNTQGYGLKGGTMVGGLTPRRNLLLIHFFARNPFPVDIGAGARAATDALRAVLPPQAMIFAPSFPVPRFPARAFILYGCLPTRYKTGSDFDASSGAISVKELDIQVELIEEVSLTA